MNLMAHNNLSEQMQYHPIFRINRNYAGACARTLSHQHFNRIADKGRFLVDAFIMRGPKINDHLLACLRHRMPVKRTLLSDALIDIT